MELFEAGMSERLICGAAIFGYYGVHSVAQDFQGFRRDIQSGRFGYWSGGAGIGVLIFRIFCNEELRFFIETVSCDNRHCICDLKRCCPECSLPDTEPSSFLFCQSRKLFYVFDFLLGY